MKQLIQKIGKIVTWSLAGIAALLLLVAFLGLQAREIDKKVFGYNAYTMLTDDMKEAKKGDLVVVKPVAAEELKVGDVISYQCIDIKSDYCGEILTHKIQAFETDSDGIAIIVVGSSETGEAQGRIAYNFVMGKQVTAIGGLGGFIDWMTEPAGYFVVIGIPLLLLAGMQIWLIIDEYLIYRKKKYFGVLSEEERAEWEAMQAAQAEDVALEEAQSEEILSNEAESSEQ